MIDRVYRCICQPFTFESCGKAILASYAIALLQEDLCFDSRDDYRSFVWQKFLVLVAVFGLVSTLVKKFYLDL